MSEVFKAPAVHFAQPDYAEAPPHAGPAQEVLLAVAEVGREISGAGGLELRLEHALCAIDRRLGANRSALFALDAESRRLSIRAAHGLTADQLRPRLDGGVAGRVLATGLPVVVPVVRHDPMALSELSDLAHWRDPGWNLVAVPVQSHRRNLGVLCAYFRYRDPGGFGDRLSALDVIASLLGRALRTPRSGGDAPAMLPPSAAGEAASPSAFEYANMVGQSPAMRQVYEQIGQIARTNATALLRGESGTGKELVAHAIHKNSRRANQPFVKVNCAALPDTLFESELFGHERGAFTGAHSRKKGRFELAQGGTLFLDEIGELSAKAQAKLLRALQFREFERVGGTETLRTDVRIIAATNVDMEEAVRAGGFREDLYYRINVFTITLPPLRERRADIAPLAEYFLAKWAAEHQRDKITRISHAALDVLMQHAWPGNVRELENVIERAVVVCDGSVMEEQHLPNSMRESRAPARLTLSEAVEKLERQMIEEALHAAGGNLAAAARMLGATERVIRYKARKLHVGDRRARRT